MTQLDDMALARRRNASPVPPGVRARRLLWSLVQGTLYRFSFHTWNGWRAALLRLFGATVGRRCTLRRTSRVYYPWLLELGDNCALGDRSEVYNLARITLGKRVTVSQEAYLCAGTHDYTDPHMPLVALPIHIGSEAWVCARAFLGPGVTIGEGAIVAACGVVTKDVPAWTIVGGNPARFIKRRERFP
jgi:putative colanic acid biosynthesis acetyltransferase WcaF